ncbi:MAG TPA: hypothetical protein DCW90_01385 [Lachnospiraceae bacterium]|nr:hypothetical protein [Lachnospiraceae bacterium]
MIETVQRNQEQLPTAVGVAVNAPVHLKKEILSSDNKSKVTIPLCGKCHVPPILLTDDIYKCTCEDCINLAFDLSFMDYLAYILKGVKGQ